MVPIDHFDAVATTRLEREAIVDDQGRFTYARLITMSRQIAGWIARRARRSQPSVALYGRNSYRLLVAMLGTMRAGCAIVPLHERATGESCMPLLSAVEPELLFYDASRRSQVEYIRAHLKGLRDCVCLDDGGDAPTLAEILNGPDAYVADWIEADGNSERPVYYWTTSGTTGEPKIAVENVRCFNTALNAARVRRSKLASNVLLTTAPMSHVGGPVSFSTLALGGTVIIPKNVAPEQVLATIERERVSELWLSPTALSLLLDHPNLSCHDVSSVKSILMGMSGVSPRHLARAVATFGPCIGHTYSQVETGVVTVLDPTVVAAALGGVKPERLRSSGTSAGINRFAIMGPDGTILGVGEEGEIVVRGSGVKPYLETVLTRTAQASGWHRTGDIGYVDQDGFLYVVGRLRDVINVGGLKIAASHIERVLMEMEEIRECAVIAVPDPIRGEAAKAIVVAASGREISVSQVIRHCASRLGVGKAPHVVELWPELPKSPTGKIDKNRIRQLMTTSADA